MRAHFVASPMVGHVLPLVPLATAFQDAGHDVLVATGGDGLEAGRRAGAPVHDVCPGLNLPAVFAGSLLRHPLRLGRMMLGKDDGTDGVGLMFAAVAERMAERTIALVAQWRPDIVLHEPLSGAGPLAAARAGVPAVLVDRSNDWPATRPCAPRPVRWPPRSPRCLRQRTSPSRSRRWAR